MKPLCDVEVKYQRRGGDWALNMWQIYTMARTHGRIHGDGLIKVLRHITSSRSSLIKLTKGHWPSRFAHDLLTICLTYKDINCHVLGLRALLHDGGRRYRGPHERQQSIRLDVTDIRSFYGERLILLRNVYMVT